MSTLKLGEFTVLRRRLAGTPHTRYTVMLRGSVIGHQLSAPTPDDCRGYSNRLDLNGRRRTEGPRNSLIGEIVVQLSPGEMNLTELSTNLRRSNDTLSPLLNRMVRAGTLVRSGKPGAFRFGLAKS